MSLRGPESEHGADEDEDTAEEGSLCSALGTSSDGTRVAVPRPGIADPPSHGASTLLLPMTPQPLLDYEPLAGLSPATLRRATEDPKRMSDSLLPDGSSLVCDGAESVAGARISLRRPASPGRAASPHSAAASQQPTSPQQQRRQQHGQHEQQQQQAGSQTMNRSVSFTASLVRTASSRSVRSSEKLRAVPKNLSNRFLVGNVIGRGSYAKVRDAYDIHYGTVVAVKIFKWVHLRRVPGGDVSLRRELTALRRVPRHPHVVSLVDFWRDPVQGKSYVALDYMPCGTLEDLLVAARGAPLPLAQARCLFRGLVAGLAHMHRCGVYHRDIKPDNLMLRSSTHLCVSDFGTATTDAATEGVGAPAFQPPEVAADGRAPLADRLDVWAAGITLFIMATGRYPYPVHKSLFQTFQIISTTDVDVPADLPPPLQQLLHGMLARDPAARLTIDQVAESPWLADVADDGTEREEDAHSFVAVETRSTIFTPESIPRFLHDLVPQHAEQAPCDSSSSDGSSSSSSNVAEERRQEPVHGGHVNEKTGEFVPQSAARSCTKTGCTVQ